MIYITESNSIARNRSYLSNGSVQRRVSVMYTTIVINRLLATINIDHPNSIKTNSTEPFPRYESICCTGGQEIRRVSQNLKVRPLFHNSSPMIPPISQSYPRHELER